MQVIIVASALSTEFWSPIGRFFWSPVCDWWNRLAKMWSYSIFDFKLYALPKANGVVLVYVVPYLYIRFFTLTLS